MSEARTPIDVDVVIVGGGPAGLACAAELLDASELRLAIVDAGAALGGQYWRQPATPRPGTGRADRLERGELAYLHHDLPTLDRLLDTIDGGVDSGRVTVLSEHHAWSALPDPTGGFAVRALDRSGPPGRERPVLVRATSLVVATGAYDRALPFPGWELPGVMTPGALQALLKAGGVPAGRRVVVGGSGPFLLPVAAGLARAGAEVAGVFEANPARRWLREWRTVIANAAKLGEGAGYAATLARHRVPVTRGAMITAAHGDDRVESVTVARVDSTGGVVPGSSRHVTADAVGVGWGFTPQLDLLQPLGVAWGRSSDGTAVARVDELQRTSLSGVYAAGETSGVGGAALAVDEGRLAAWGCLADRWPHPVEPERILVLRRRAARARRFADSIIRAHPVPGSWREVLEPDTTICRCEEVDHACVRRAIDERGAGDARQVKQLTRTGMGWCQGRVCGYAAALLSEGAPGDPVERVVASPVPLGAVADDNHPSTM